MPDKVNKASIEEIQRCIFLVSLDGPIVNPTGNIMTDAALNCVHGNGPQGYAGNRWYDKTIQVCQLVIVSSFSKEIKGCYIL